MYTRLCGAAEWDDQIHEIWILSGPLVGLACAHGPAEDGAGMRDFQVLSNELVLGADVVIEGYQGEGPEGRGVGG